MHPTLRYALIALSALAISAIAVVVGVGIAMLMDQPKKPAPIAEREWNPHWVGARYDIGENGIDGCYVIFIDKDTNQCDCSDLQMPDNYCCRLADSLERNGPAPAKK